VQVFPTLNPMKAVSYYDFDGVRCYAEPAGTLSLKVTWCDGVDSDKVLGEKKLVHYVNDKALDDAGNILPKFKALRRREQKYADRGYTITRVASLDAHSPYDEGKAWTKPIGSPPGAIILCNEVTGPPINQLDLIKLDYTSEQTRRLVMRWLEQEWLKSGCKLTKSELCAMAVKFRNPRFPLVYLGPYEARMLEYEDLVKAESLWIESGFTLTKEQLLEKVGPTPEMKPEDLFQ